MATLLSIVVNPKAFLTAYGMKDVSFTPLGILPSLHESTRTWSKSRLRVSRTPMICSPTIGSPWKGTDVDEIN